ncbi:MAG: type II secretion system protein N [Pseudomonadales bacterium]
MARAVAVGVALFLVFLVIRAPAGLVRAFIPEGTSVDLFDLDGTLWQGAGDLAVAGQPLGRLAWSFRPVTLLSAAAGYDVKLTGPELDLAGRVKAGLGGTTTTLAGQIGSPFVNVWLAPYYIELSGTFVLQDVQTRATGLRLDDVSGTIDWDGGPISYRLSGKLYRSALPPLYASLGPGSAATVFARGEATPVLHAALLENGFARIGVTKYLTRMLGNPWPGGDPDHAVVLEVEEQVF